MEKRLAVFVGTSGWSYDWNPDGFKWYARYSGLNAVELNASFYRFPFPNMVRSWLMRTEKAPCMRWAIKIHRYVSHVYMLKDRALGLWDRFHRLFQPLEEYIDFFLLQLPPRFKPDDEHLRRLERFVEHVNLGYTLAVEWRDPTWFKEEWIGLGRELRFTVVSIDSPIGCFYVRSGPYVYLRMHGRGAWYAYRYSRDELIHVATSLLRLNGTRVYAFFNNDHDMLDNAREFLEILLRLRS
ncbi:MAG: DUF72 domain-containing protein [Thermoprotei archaeon]|nr:DUF72 domain-containing protein [Thermoprotei archaeon]